jgi:hypothetical protein
MSASVIFPLSVLKTRVRPDISLSSPMKGDVFSVVCAIVIKLRPSPLPLGALMD